MGEENTTQIASFDGNIRSIPDLKQSYLNDKEQFIKECAMRIYCYQDFSKDSEENIANLACKRAITLAKFLFK